MNTHSISLFALAVASVAGPPAFADTAPDASVTAVAALGAPAPADPAPEAVAPEQTDIIVTGTRRIGTTAAESATPIKVLGSDELSRVGQPNLNQVLTQLVPSFTAQAFGGDTANLTLSARLRGLSPNHTLVLINGKRRHGTANLAVLGGPYQGAATADLDLISPSAIARIEVLEDGAAAQYGSDAIAGVINIILKDDAEGGSGYATAGKNYDVGGTTYAGTAHLATRIGEDGFINVTLFHRFHDFTQVGGLDRRVTDANGALLTTTTSPALSAASPL
jgi:iron complex outermembrane recepter protein